MFQLRSENIHFAAIFKYDFVIEVGKCLLSLIYMLVLNECFPNFCLFEDEYFDYGAVGAKKFIEIIMSDDIPKLIIDAD